jgi:hypothetical protein
MMFQMKRYLLILGQLAAAGMPAVATIDVTQFGAAPDGGKDDTAAFVAAFGAAQTNHDKLIVIPKGRYHLRTGASPRRNTLVSMNNMDGLTIEGRGAELMMSGNGSIFHFTRCRNIAIRGLTVDWDRPPFSQGTVIATASNYFDVQIEKEFPVHGGEKVGAFMSYDLATRLPAGRDMDDYYSVERTELVAPQVLRLHLKHNMKVPVGTLLVLRHEVYTAEAILFNHCADVGVNNVTIYTAPGMALVARLSTNISLERFDVRIRPGSGRMMSSSADASHFAGCRGAVSLTDCTFEGMGDDGVNIRTGNYLTVLKRLDGSSVECQNYQKYVCLPDDGDVLEISHTNTLVPYFSGKVKTAELLGGPDRLHRIVFEGRLPGELREGDVLANTRAARLRMRHCTVAANRARGVLSQTRDVVIEDCTFRNCTSAGVLVLTEIEYWFESIGGRDVTVRNNLFENCNMGAASREAALAAVAWFKGGGDPPVPGVHRDVVFEGNRIIGTGDSGIYAVGVDGLTIRSNTVERACLKPTYKSGHDAIRVLNSARVVMENNTVDPKRQGPGMTAPMLVTNCK